MARYTSIFKAYMKGILVISALATLTSIGVGFAAISLVVKQNGTLPTNSDIHDPSSTLKKLASKTSQEFIDDMANIVKIPDWLLKDLVTVTKDCKEANVAALQFWPLGWLSPGLKSLIIGAAVGTLILACIQLVAAIMAIFSSSVNFVSRTITWRITLALCLPLTFIMSLIPFSYEPNSNDSYSAALAAVPVTFNGMSCLIEMNKDHAKLWHDGLSSLYFVVGNVSYAGFQLCLLIVSILVAYFDGRKYSQV